MTSAQISVQRFCTNFFSLNTLDSSVGIVISPKDVSSGVRMPEWARVIYSLLQKVQLGSGDNPASYSSDNGVKHSGREVYNLSSSRIECMNEWNCISISLYAFIGWTGNFRIFLMRATCRTHHVVIRLVCSMKLPSFKVLPAATSRPPHIQPPHHSAHQLPHATSQAHRDTLFIVIKTMAKDNFNFHILQVSLLSCHLLSCISTLVVHMQATRACRVVEVQRHTFLRWH